MTNSEADVSPRLLAARIIAKWRETGAFPDRLIRPDTVNRAVVTETVYGAVRHYRTLQWIGDICTKHRSAPLVQALLLVGLYELLFMDTAADYATVNEIVEAARAGGSEYACGFLNAVLRRVIREREALRARVAEQKLSIRESHPDELVDRWQKNFGFGATERLCCWNNEPARVSIRPNTTKTDCAKLSAALMTAGIETEPCPAAADEFLYLPRGVSVPAVPGYRRGEFTVQDPATVQAVKLLDPQPGERILDACAAPGGKAMLIAERLGGTGDLVAEDMHEDRLAVLRENVKRMRLSAITIRRNDLLSGATSDETFDRVLLDVPCTNTGVLRRRPDARWRFSATRLARLVKSQHEMLTAAAERLAPGGRLVYSTCSLEPEENQILVAAWLVEQPVFKRLDEHVSFPPDAGTDGAYCASLVREE